MKRPGERLLGEFVSNSSTLLALAYGISYALQ